jgi:hypothetical protein
MKSSLWPLLCIPLLLNAFYTQSVLGQSSGPVATAVASLCKQMPGMPGCTINQMCTKASSQVPSPFCLNESILADICMYDMPSMSDCTTYNSTCSPSTCKPIPKLPTSKQATQAIFSICNEMNMDGCEKCKISSGSSSYSNCDLLGTYSQLCISMPEMKQCNEWKAMCSESPSLSLCSNNAPSDPPTMKMYFHLGIKDYILFQKAVPQNDGEYVLALFLVFFFSTLYEGYQVIYMRALDWAETITAKNRGVDISLYSKILGASTRILIRVIGAGWSYLLMLVTMTFNVGLFMAVIVGLGVGSAIFGPFHSRYNSLRMAEIQKSELCC